MVVDSWKIVVGGVRMGSIDLKLRGMEGARKTLLYCTVLFDVKWIFWQNNNFNE